VATFNTLIQAAAGACLRIIEVTGVFRVPADFYTFASNSVLGAILGGAASRISLAPGFAMGLRFRRGHKRSGAQ
jgi:hypothetical protein